MAAQPGVAEALDTLVCGAPGFREAIGKTLSGSIDENASDASCLIAQVSLYSLDLGGAIAQTTYATDASG